MENKKEEENKKEVRIQIPNTRFIYVGRQEEDMSWRTSVFDPDNGTSKRCEGIVPNTVFHLIASLVLKTPLNLK